MRTFTILFAMSLLCFDLAAEPLTLGRAQQLAVERAPSLRAASAQVDASDEATSALRATSFPRINLNAAYQYSQPIPEVELPTPDGPRTVELGKANTALVGIGTQWAVFSWSRLRSVRASELQIKANALERRAQLLTLEQRVRDLYLACLYLDEIVDATEVARVASDLAVQSISSEIEVGLAAEVELAAARARLAELDARLTGVKSERDALRSTLKIVLGVELTKTLKFSETIDDVHTTLDRLGDRTQPMVERFRVQSAAANEQALASLSLPTLMLLANVDYRFPTTPFADQAGIAWSVGAKLSWALWSGGQKRAQRRRAEANARAATAMAQHQTETLQAAIVSAESKVASTASQIEARLEQLDAAKGFLKLAKASLDAGSIRILDVLDAEVKVDQARLAIAKARFDLTTAKSALLFAHGIQFSEKERR